MVVKLGMANAFERVYNSFLFLILKQFGFNGSLINWIKACISELKIAPLTNGRSTSFQRNRGKRQGCPLSPLLYIIMEKSLSHNLERQREKGNHMIISFVRGVREINHSQFANNTLLLGGAS